MTWRGIIILLVVLLVVAFLVSNCSPIPAVQRFWSTESASQAPVVGKPIGSAPAGNCSEMTAFTIGGPPNATFRISPQSGCTFGEKKLVMSEPSGDTPQYGTTGQNVVLLPSGVSSFLVTGVEGTTIQDTPANQVCNVAGKAPNCLVNKVKVSR